MRAKVMNHRFDIDTINNRIFCEFTGAFGPTGTRSGTVEAFTDSFAVREDETVDSLRGRFADLIEIEAVRLGYVVTRGEMIIPAFATGPVV